MLVLSGKVFVILFLFINASFSYGASLNRNDIKSIKDDYSESEDLQRDESNVDNAVHVATNNQHSDTDEDDSKVIEHDDPDEDQENDNGATEDAAFDEAEAAETSQSELTSIHKDFEEAKAVNKKLQEQMDALNSKILDVLKSSDVEKESESDNAQSKDEDDQEKASITSENKDTNRLKSEAQPNTDVTSDVSKISREESLPNDEIGEDQNVEADPDY